ncbi:MAG: transglutaminase domain-containing protein, partial [Bdellovibrionota bacterium]
AGLPARVAAGLVYLRDGFYYHAWSELFVGRWVTADATFGQFPADVTHLRLAGGSPASQARIANLLGRVQITVEDFR